MSFLQQLEQDLKTARTALYAARIEDGLAITSRYAGPTSRNRDFLILHAELLHRAERYEEANAFYERVLELDPGNGTARLYLIRGLRILGQNDRALELARKARAELPGHGALLGSYLSLVLTEKGLPVAMAELAAAVAASARSTELDQGIDMFREKVLSLYDMDEIKSLDAGDLLKLRQQGDAAANNLSLIYERFESLGANCDFGFIQRRRGAEPLSLFRWTSITPPNLIRLLSCDLADYEEPSRYELRGRHEREYMLYESAYETLGHTGVNSADIAEDEFLNRLTRRQAFLKRKFLAELAAGQKIFIYKAHEPIPEEQMAAIERELVRLGARNCMFTEPTDDPAKFGTVEFPSATRANGYISRGSFTEKIGEWDRVIVAAYEHFVGRAAKAA